MAVDFASKQRERGGQGWGLRNAKLRLSRKLIFAAGLLTCFSCEGLPVLEEPELDESPTLSRLLDYVRLTPLEILAKELLARGIQDDVSKDLFDAYDEFLSILDDGDKRKRLKDHVTPENCRDDEVFQKMQKLGRKFQQGLDKLFYSNSLDSLTRKYAIF